MSFKRFDKEDVVISAESVTAPVWSNNVVTLQTFVTSSTQAQSTAGDYYLEMYNGDPSVDTSALQFTIGYADRQGSGSLFLDQAVSHISPTLTNYRQFRNLITGDEETDIKFGGVTADHFFVISLERARYKEKLLPGTFELTLQHSGSITLIDSSPYGTTQVFSDAGREYDIYKKHGSAGYSSSFSTSGSWGKFLPDVGLILLNTALLASSGSAGNPHGIGLNIARGSNSDAENTLELFEALKDGNSFKLNSEETISSNYVFIRARNSEFNYSTNPSLLTGSGELRHSVMIDSPESYITTVGLYNDANDLLAVGKLSRPLLKNSTKESLIRMKLDY